MKTHTFVDTIEVLGVAKGIQSVTLAAAATQLVERVRFSDGQYVQRGAILVELKDTEQGAGVTQAEARLTQAQRAFDRYRQLGERGFASKAAIDQHEANFRSAEADLAVAHARASDRVIRAPFAGVVGLSDIAPGSLINPGAPIVTLDDLSRVRVDFQVPERYLAQLSEGQDVLATVDAYPGDTITGQIAKHVTRVDERTHALTARAEFLNLKGRLKPGMLVRVSVARGERESLSAPESAVSVQGDSPFVYVLLATDGGVLVEQRPIVTGVRQQGLVEVLEGIRAGDRIVADGVDRIEGGQTVRIAGAGPPGVLGMRPGGAENFMASTVVPKFTPPPEQPQARVALVSVVIASPVVLPAQPAAASALLPTLSAPVPAQVTAPKPKTSPTQAAAVPTASETAVVQVGAVSSIVLTEKVWSEAVAAVPVLAVGKGQERGADRTGRGGPLPQRRDWFCQPQGGRELLHTAEVSRQGLFRAVSLSACILGCSGSSLTGEEAAFLHDVRGWGFILFACNVEVPEPMVRLTASAGRAVGWPDVLGMQPCGANPKIPETRPNRTRPLA